MTEPNTGKTIKLDSPITASGFSIAGFTNDNTWHDCRELLPMRVTNRTPDADVISGWCLIVTLDDGIYLGYYNHTRNGWYECTPDWRYYDMEDESVAQFYKIAQPYMWRYLPTLPDTPTIREDQ